VLHAALTPQIVQQFDIRVSEGALIAEVPSDGPAAQAGIRPGDVVTAIGETQVSTVEDLLGALRRQKPGDQVSVSIVRDGRATTVDVMLGDFPRIAG
jgi:S1-C subfamily serine protease